jgi:ABC-type maltose transport system permease subunit
MELLAVAALFIGLALLAAIPLVILLHVTQRHSDGEG